METLTTVMEVDKETKGTIRYAEVETDDLPVLSTVYVPKFSTARIGKPTRIRVTIEAVD